MKLFYLTIFFTLAFSSSFSIDGMKCAKSCVNKIKNEIQTLDGVNNLELDFKNSVMMVDYDETKLNDQKIINYLSENTSYSASIIRLNSQKNCSKGIFSKMFCGIKSMFFNCSK